MSHTSAGFDLYPGEDEREETGFIVGFDCYGSITMLRITDEERDGCIYVYAETRPLLRALNAAFTDGRGINHEIAYTLTAFGMLAWFEVLDRVFDPKPEENDDEGA